MRAIIGMYKLDIASKEAIDYACKYFHYSKSVPVNVHGYSVFYDDVWCGVILYSLGANNNLAKSFGMKQGQVIELTRVALNGKQKEVSKPLSISLKLIKKHLPLCRIVVSYADEKQGHAGGIYQATNWLFVGDSFSESAIDPADGQVKHTRTLHAKYGSIKGFQRVKDKAKHKYLYIIDESLKKHYQSQSKPYPKKTVSL